MNTTTLKPILGPALLCAFLLAPFAMRGQATQTSTSSSSGVTTEGIVTTTVTVTAVDQKARTVTVKGADGGETTMSVSDEVKRLAEVKVGDQLNIGYLESVGLEFRAPTAEELAEPLKVTEQTDKAGNDRAPAGAALRTIRAVVTVEGISRWLSALTVKGPRGNYFVVEVDPGSLKWEELRIGQQMVGTYTEAMVMSIEHAPQK